MLASREEIKRVIKDIRNRRNKWVLSRRPKNMATLANLAIQETLALDIIYNKISWQDYISGPETDGHPRPIPGDIWVFGLIIENVECYLKFQDRPNGGVVWISLHDAKYPMNYPYK